MRVETREDVIIGMRMSEVEVLRRQVKELRAILAWFMLRMDLRRLL